MVPCTGEPASLSVSGTWAAYGQLSVHLEGATGGAITICPTDQVGAATMLLLITVQQNAADPTKLDQMKATLCSIELPTVTALVGTCDPHLEGAGLHPARGAAGVHRRAAQGGSGDRDRLRSAARPRARP